MVSPSGQEQIANKSDMRVKVARKSEEYLLGGRDGKGKGAERPLTKESPSFLSPAAPRRGETSGDAGIRHNNI